LEEVVTRSPLPMVEELAPSSLEVDFFDAFFLFAILYLFSLHLRDK
jgi:hypothetical protein